MFATTARITELMGNKNSIKCMFCNRKYHNRKETPWKVNNHFIEESSDSVHFDDKERPTSLGPKK